ncbi:MAG: PD-(D/E)XK nuclease family protein [Desulforudis sp.]|nr:MAG: PD-(D/E)XK nuclease family protein [Desulforudis sp.]
MQIFSYSRLDKFRCPAAFYNQYVLGHTEPPTEPLVLGGAVHAVIEAALTAGRDDESFFRAMSGVAADVAPVKIDPDEVFGLACQPLVRRLVNWGGSVEERFQMPLDPEDPFGPEIQGYLDFWLDGLEVLLVDWKTNRKAYNPLDTHQLGLYAGWLHEKTGKPVRGKLVFLRTGEVREHLYTPEDGIAAARDWAYETAVDIRERLYALQNGGDRKELFPAAPGAACLYCGWADSCTGKEINVPDFVRGYDEAATLGREILRLETAADILKGRLRGWVERHGPVTVDSREFRIAPSNYWKWPQESLKKAVAAMEHEGVDPFKILSLTAAGLKKLGWDGERIRALGASLQHKEDFRHVAKTGSS